MVDTERFWSTLGIQFTRAVAQLYLISFHSPKYYLALRLNFAWVLYHHVVRWLYWWCKNLRVSKQNMQACRVTHDWKTAALRHMSSTTAGYCWGVVPESPRGPAVNWNEWQEWQHRCCVCNWNTYNSCIQGICGFLVKTQNVVILFTIGPFKNSQHCANCVSTFIAKGNTTVYPKCKTPLLRDLFLIPMASAINRHHERFVD